MNLHTPKIELLLRPHELLSLENTQRNMAIECKEGVVWVTCAGENNDHMLTAGNRYTPKTSGEVVIEALGKACVDIESK
jgi:ferric-dicitrate binding protein FerR (iron transport regulator)